ncbi:transcription factor WhiB, partial [Mycobacterium rufum]|nr:transcription factor WhiB [Mycolicibacterium rufum]
MNATPWDETPVGECTRDPDRWTTTADDEAKAICRSCPRRWLCAKEACESPR